MKRFLPVIVIISVIALYASYLTPRLKFGGDAVDYVRLADSLAHGEGYRVDGQFNSKWPPVTPLLHSLVIRTMGFSVAGFKFASMLCALTGLWLSYLLLKRHYDARLAFGAVLLAAVSFPMIYWLVDISSEAPYFLFSITGLLLSEEALKRQRWPWVVGAGLAFGLAILSRTIGLALVIGLGLALIPKLVRGFRSDSLRLSLVAVIAVVIAGTWFVYSRIQSGQSSVSAYGSYAFRGDIYNPESKSDLRTWFWRAKENAIGYTFIFGVPDSSLRLKNTVRLTPRGMASALIVTLALAGWAWHLRKGPQIAEWYLICYGGVLLIVAWYDIRYLVPILPFVFYYMLFALDRSFQWGANRVNRPTWGNPATTVAAILLILANSAVSIASPQAQRLRAKEYSGVAKDIYDSAMWIQSHHPHATIVARNPGMVWFWTKMRVLSFPWYATPEQVLLFIENNQVDFVILDADEYSGVTGKYLKPALESHPDRFEQVAAFGTTRVLRVRPRPSP